MPKPFAVLLPAAGSGNRYGAGDKLLADIAGRTVLQRSVQLFTPRPEVAQILIVTSPERFNLYREHLNPILPADIRIEFTAGGRERWESVLFGLRHLAQSKNTPTHVAIHDAARPLTPQTVIDQVFAAALANDAALPGVPEPATLKRQNPDGSVAETVNRRGLFQAQTPQCFRLDLLLAAYESLLQKNQVADLTDDAQVFERTGRGVQLTVGDARNLEITTTEDLHLARAILAAESFT